MADLKLAGLVGELAEFGTKAAQAAAMIAELRDADVDVATIPREEVHRIGGRTLYHIAPSGPRRVATPVLVTYAMVGRWTILDLQEDRSFLRNLSEAGCELYVLDWGHPTPADQFDDFGDLVNLYLDGFVDVICDRHDIEAVNLLGICRAACSRSSTRPCTRPGCATSSPASRRSTSTPTAAPSASTTAS